MDENIVGSPIGNIVPLVAETTGTSNVGAVPDVTGEIMSSSSTNVLSSLYHH